MKGTNKEKRMFNNIIRFFSICSSVVVLLVTFTVAAQVDDDANPDGKKDPFSDQSRDLETSDEGTEDVPFNIGLFPYANINAYKDNPVNNFSWDVILGLNHKVRGVVMGAVSVVLEDTKGAQLGVFNFSKKLTGLQIGLVNYADEASENSATVGLINIVRKGGRHSLDIWTSDTSLINIGTKIGGNRVYAIWSFSLQPKMHSDIGDQDTVFWGPGIGIGFNIPIVNPWSIAIESHTMALFDDEPKISPVMPVGTMPDTITQLRLVGNYQINKLVGVYAGIAFNVYLGGKVLRNISYLPDSAIIKDPLSDGPVPGQVGIGFLVGVQLF